MLNTVVLQGRLTADPEHKQTQNGVALCKFRLAVDRGYKSKGEGQSADFINVTAWRGLADTITTYCSRGQMILVRGRLETNSYTNQDGSRVTTTTVVADEFSFCGGARESSASQTSKAEPAQESADVPAFAEIEDTDAEMPF